MKLRSLKRCDHSRAVDFAVRGMHFDWYMNSRFLKQLYGRYFLCLSLCRASQVIAAYEGERLAGVLIADFNDKKRLWSTPLKRGFVHLFCLLQGIYASGADVYDNANREMYTEFLKEHSPQGEILFLAVSPEFMGKGVGTRLLCELPRRCKGKLVYLYTDNACNYGFYEHMGFERSGEKDIILELPPKKVPLKCFLYSKRL